MSFVQLPIQLYPNTSLGYGSLQGASAGYGNIAIGRTNGGSAGGASNNNIFVGDNSGGNGSIVSVKFRNVFVGTDTGLNSVSADDNTFIGNGAGSLVTFGSRNVIIGEFNGNQGGIDIRTANNNCIISDGSGNPRIYDNNGSTAIGVSYAAGGQSAFAASNGSNNGLYGSQTSYCVSLGYLAKSNGAYAFSAGYAPLANSSWSVAIGYNATTSASGATAIGAFWNHGAPTASGQGAVAIGDGVISDGANSFAFGAAAITNGITGKQAYSGSKFAALGDSQHGKYVLRRETTNAVPAAMATNNIAAGSTNQIILPNNSAMSFSGTVVARQKASDGTSVAAWSVSGIIRREANAASTTLVASTVTVISNAPGFGLALSADTTNGGLALTVTGIVFVNVRWVANIDTAEVTYA